jgi:glucans biosynthesis protein
MHGGAKGSGAPRSNQNALKHGTYTKAAFRQRAEMRELFREVRKMLLDEPES